VWVSHAPASGTKRHRIESKHPQARFSESDFIPTVPAQTPGTRHVRCRPRMERDAGELPAWSVGELLELRRCCDGLALIGPTVLHRTWLASAAPRPPARRLCRRDRRKTCGLTMNFGYRLPRGALTRIAALGAPSPASLTGEGGGRGGGMGEGPQPSNRAGWVRVAPSPACT